MNTMNEMNRIEEIESKLRNPENFTGYYMSMRKLEAETGKAIGIRRYRRH